MVNIFHGFKQRLWWLFITDAKKILSLCDSHVCVFQTVWRVTDQKVQVRRMKMRTKNKGLCAST